MILDFRFWILDFLKRRWRLALAIGAVALAFLVVFPYYAWKAAIRREIQGQFQRSALEFEISNLKAQAAEAEKSAVRSQQLAAELAAKLEKSAVRSRQLAADLEKTKADGAAEQARIAALPPDQLGVELQKTVTTTGILRFAQDDSEGARRVLEIITDADACKDQLAIKDLQFANCRESLVDYAAMGEQQAIQVRELKQALDLERRAFDKRDDLAKVEVKAAKGSWLGRVAGKAKWFVVGVGVGTVAGAMAAR